METSFKQLMNRLPVLYVKGLAIYAAYRLLEIPFQTSIKTARVAESNFRNTLPSAISMSWVWSYFVETLLCVPVVSGVTCLFLKIFAKKIQEPIGLDQYWLNQDYDALFNELDQMFQSENPISWKPKGSFAFRPAQLDQKLCNYTLDLTSESSFGRLWPSVGRSKEHKEIEKILKRTTKNVPLLVGPKGVGKTGLIQGLVPKHRVLLLTWESLIGRGEYYNAEKYLRELADLIKRQRTPVIVCIDDIDKFFERRADVGAHLRAFMKSGFPCIAVSSHHHRNLEDIVTLVEVSNPLESDLLEMLKHKRHELEIHYKVRISDEALAICVDIAKNHLPKEVFPKKANELLDEAANALRAEVDATVEEKKIASYLQLLLYLKSLSKDPEKFDPKIAEVRDKFSIVIKAEDICKLVGIKLITPAQRHLDSLLEKGDLAAIFAALEEMMKTAEGIDWKPTLPQGYLPPLPKPLEYLSTYARDLTLEVAQGRHPPFYGREKEFEKIAEILGRNHKNTPLLLGAPGVGKSAMAVGLAQLIIKNDPKLPMVLRGKRLFLLQWDRLKSDEKSLGSNLSHILQEAQQNKSHLILFIDDIHTFVDQKSKTAEILKPALSDGLINCISTTTPWNFKKIAGQDAVLERKLPTVEVFEESEEQVISFLKKYRHELEAYYAVRISDEAIQECYDLGKRYLKSNSFPDKGIYLLTAAASRLKMKHPPSAQDVQIARLLGILLFINHNDKIEEVRTRLSQVVSVELIREVVAEEVEIPLQKIEESELELLQSLEERMSRKIIGQKDPIRALCQAVRRGRVGMGKTDTPAGVFLMLGSTGVGKTASARALAEILYGSNERLLRIDMSEFKEKIDINKLIGSPPGYMGYDHGGMLTNWLRKNPNSIVLFDEIEKAHPEVFDLFLQLFDAGRLTDGHGVTVNCLDTIFIMTSNLGSNVILEKHDSSLSEEDLLEQVQPLLAAKFRPEFLNRIQETIIFYPLTQNEVRNIVLLQLNEFKARAEANTHCPQIQISWDDSLVRFLSKTGYNPDKGARELSRRITRSLVNPLADMIIKEEVQPGDKLSITSDGSSVKIQKLE